MAVQPDPYFALPSLYGAPAYSRPPRPAMDVARPIDPDDLPLATHQTEDERRLAEALLASRGQASVEAGMGPGLRGGGHPAYQVPGTGQPDRARRLLPRRLSLRGLTEHVRTRG